MPFNQDAFRSLFGPLRSIFKAVSSPLRNLMGVFGSTASNLSNTAIRARDVPGVQLDTVIVIRDLNHPHNGQRVKVVRLHDDGSIKIKSLNEKSPIPEVRSRLFNSSQFEVVEMDTQMKLGDGATGSPANPERV